MIPALPNLSLSGGSSEATSRQDTGGVSFGGGKIGPVSGGGIPAWIVPAVAVIVVFYFLKRR